MGNLPQTRPPCLPSAMSYFRPELKSKAGRMERLAMAGVGPQSTQRGKHFLLIFIVLNFISVISVRSVLKF